MNQDDLQKLIREISSMRGGEGSVEISEKVKAAEEFAKEKLSDLKEMIHNINSTGNGEKKPLNRKTIVAIMVVLIVVVSIFIGLRSYNDPAKKLTKQMDLGYRYLAELDYEQAVVAFMRVIEIDPMNVEAYFGLIEAYIGLKDIPSALETAKKGYEAIYDDRLNMQRGFIYDSLQRLKIRIFYNETENIAWVHVYTYFPDELRIASAAVYDGTGTEKGKINLFYDEEERLVRGFWYRDREYEWNKGDGEQIWLAEYHYEDEELNRVDLYKDVEGNELYASRLFEDGLETRKEYYRNDGTLQGYSDCECDEEGKIIKQFTYWEAESGFEEIGQVSWNWGQTRGSVEVRSIGARGCGYCTYEYNKEKVEEFYRFDESLLDEYYTQSQMLIDANSLFWSAGELQGIEKVAGE